MPASSPKTPSLDDLLDAVDRLEKSDFDEVDLRIGEARVRVTRAGAFASAPESAPVVTAAVAPAPAPQPAAATSDAGGNDAVAEGLEELTAPMVGTFYRRLRPDADPLVEVGDQVKQGQVLCIIEAMKLMNNIEAEVAGEVVEIVPEDASPVQYGDRLFLIRPA